MAPAGIGGSVEGFHAVAAAVEAGRVEELFVVDSKTKAFGELLAMARLAGVTVTRVEDLRGLATTSLPQGVVARARPIMPVNLEELLDPPPAAVLILDHIEDPRNIGAAARSAVAAGATGLVVTQRRAAPMGATAFKAAAGALERLPVAVVSSIADAIARLNRYDVWTIGLDALAPDVLWGHHLLSEPVAIVVGSEGEGLSRLVRERVSVTARIPLAGGVESLNASVAASLAMFEVARARAG